MTPEVDLYDSSYANYGADVYRGVRIETYGHDLGQTSWVTREESAEIPRLLGLNSDSSVLEIGCGSGGYALHLAGSVGCRLVGLDVNGLGIQNANQLAQKSGLASRARFEQFDASQQLPFEKASFGAVFANDVLCHLPGRGDVLREIFRVLDPGGRLLFSDALVIGGMVSHQDIATRSSIGFYVYSPPGENERLLEQAGFQLVRALDTTDAASRIAKQWHQARENRKTELVKLETAANFEGLQSFLSCVQRLTAERRLLRYLYLAEKPSKPR
jgi:ubiquinone/menaquinone biosynthesis C-methylase UbiE